MSDNIISASKKICRNKQISEACGAILKMLSYALRLLKKEDNEDNKRMKGEQVVVGDEEDEVGGGDAD